MKIKWINSLTGNGTGVRERLNQDVTGKLEEEIKEEVTVAKGTKGTKRKWGG